MIQLRPMEMEFTTSQTVDIYMQVVADLKAQGYRIARLQKCSGPIEYDGSLEPAYFIDEEL